VTALVQDIKTVLSTLAPAGGVWYQVNTAQPAVYPYIVFARVPSTANASLGGPSAMQNTRVQIDIVSRLASETVALEGQLEAAMAAWSVQNVPVSSVDLYEDQVRAYRISKDYSVWASN